MNQRIYVVDTPTGQVLVEASSQAQAVNTVVGTRYKARIAKPAEIVRMMKAGTRPEGSENVIASA